MTKLRRFLLSGKCLLGAMALAAGAFATAPVPAMPGRFSTITC